MVQTTVIQKMITNGVMVNIDRQPYLVTKCLLVDGAGNMALLREDAVMCSLPVHRTQQVVLHNANSPINGGEC